MRKEKNEKRVREKEGQIDSFPIQMFRTKGFMPLLWEEDFSLPIQQTFFFFFELTLMPGFLPDLEGAA